MGKIEIFNDFYSPLDKFKRTVRVYTPDSYEQNPDKYYPVIYMTDGQNVFEHPQSARRDTWKVNETLEKMWQDGRLKREWIVCAIDHEIDRFGEYTPWYYPAASVYDPKGRKFLNNMTEFFIPWMNARYRTLKGPQNTTLMGSSLGGLISLFCGRERPDVFGRIGAISPSVMWADFKTFEHWNSKQDFWTKIYIDMGSEERITVQDIYMDYAAVVGDFYHHLRSLGYAEHEVSFYIDPGGVHSEECWARRFPHIVETLLNAE